ncbi:MAG: glutaredoxin family protein [Methylococcales bacterium]
MEICSKFILYGTDGCHLCDEARDMVDMVLSSQNSPIDYAYIDIIADDQLLDLYGESIPVIQAIQSNRQLCWPFDGLKLFEFLKEL